MGQVYAPLWCKSNFSFLEGASDPRELIERGVQVGLRSIAVTDRDGLYGVVQAHLAAREAGLHLIVGAEMTVADPGPLSVSLPDRIRAGSEPTAKPGTQFERPDVSTIVLLVQDRDGYRNLCRLITRGRRRSPKGESTVTWQEVAEHAGGLIALWGGDRSLLARADGGDGAEQATGMPLDQALRSVAPRLKDAFGNRLFAMISRHRRADEVRREWRLRERAGRWELPLVAATEVLYHSPGRRDVQDVLSCIRHGVKLTDAGRRIRANAEHALLTPDAFARAHSDDPAAIARTCEIAERCTFSMEDLRYRYPAERLPDGTTTHEWLRHLTLKGAERRYRDEAAVPVEVVEQLDKELALIEELDYGGYFLTMWELVRFCEERGILCQGRGSAANSAVCYCLGVTAIDPVRMGLLFERFISRERAEPPDIDLDIEHDRREEAIQHVYDKYGRDYAAMVAVIIRYRPKSAVRDVGKALGVAETSLDRLAKFLSRYDGLDDDVLRQAGLDPDTRVHRHLVRIANTLQGFPRHLSIHPGGFLLGHEPVHDLVPIENGAMEDRTVIQWEKDDVEALGLFKVDLLGLGALSLLHRAFDLLRRHRDVDLGMATIPPADEATFDMCCEADTVGTFQIESRAQMAMLPRLKPRKFYDLVVQVSIVRPGPITGGMVHPYLRRRAGEEPVEYPHECLKPVLEKTLGVPLFQEQVMKLAVVAADYSPGEADQLRRDMAAWRKTGRLERHRGRLISRMMAKGINEEFAERVFEQIRGFGEYGFPECVVGDTRIVDADTGRWIRIEDLFAGRENVRSTLTCSDELRIEPRRIVAVKQSGTKEVFRLRTALGREIEATAEHPFLTISGWRKLADLEVDDVVASSPMPKRRSQSVGAVIGSDVHWDRVTSIGPAGRCMTYDLEIEGNHNFLANDLVVHNSHAASFALIGYATAYLKRHYLPEFTCALLNSWPMGFYTPATVVQDGKRHGLVVRPVDVLHSVWDCTLEPCEHSTGKFAVRMGLRYVKGLREDEGEKVEAEVRAANAPFASIEDFAARTGISDRSMRLLAEAGGFDSLKSNRRAALWQVQGMKKATMFSPSGFAGPGDGEGRGDGSGAAGVGHVAEPDLPLGEQTPAFASLSDIDTVAWDFRTMNHSARSHLLEPFREELSAKGLPEARAVARMRDGRRVDYAGIVICRQRPGTASGVVFMTLEDETGFVNAILWPSVYEQFTVPARTLSFLGVSGKVQAADGVVHVVVDKLWDPRDHARPAAMQSRDFH